MREIKFRCWDKEKKRMSESLPIYWPFITWSYGDIEMPTDFALLKDRCEWMQYAGLKDKNGKEIYEGDIVKIYNQAIRVVEFRNSFWQMDLIEGGVLGGFGTQTDSGHKPIYRYGTDGIEIIGNIYENTELLTP